MAIEKAFIFKWKLLADLTITVTTFDVVRGCSYTLWPVDSSRLFSFVKCMTQ